MSKDIEYIYKRFCNIFKPVQSAITTEKLFYFFKILFFSKIIISKSIIAKIRESRKDKNQVFIFSLDCGNGIKE